MNSGRTLFTKHAPVDSPVGNAYLLEISKHEWLPDAATGGLFLGSINTDGVVALLFNGVRDISPDPSRWTDMSEVVTAVLGLVPVYESLDQVCPPEIAYTLAGFWDTRTFWQDAWNIQTRPFGVSRRLLGALRDYETAGGECWMLEQPVGTACHGDLRRDNLIITPDGITVVDWAYTGRGPRIMDAVTLGSDVGASGINPASILSPDGPYAALTRDDLLVALAAYSGLFIEESTNSAYENRLRAASEGWAIAALGWFEQLLTR